MGSFLDEVWQDAVGGLDWLKQVVIGEFDDHRSTSAVIADMLLSFVPGVIIVTSARDLTAVIIRLAKHPDRREKLEEWMILIACVIPLIIPILAAAAGAVVAGVGSVIGGIGGSEAGAALRATCLLLIEESGKMLEPLVKFLRRFIKGDILAVLRDIKFAKYGQDLAHYTVQFIGKLRVVIQKVAAKLIPLRGYFSSVETLLTRLNELERGFYAVQTAALQKIPLALAELDARLAKALAEEMKPLEHPAHPKFPAPKPEPVPPKPAKVPTMAGNPLGVPEGMRPEGLPPAAGEKTNLHPQTKGQPGTPADEAKDVKDSRLPKKTLTKEGWPDLPEKQAPNFVYADPVTLNPGDKVYRVIDNPSNAGGGYWSRELPANMAEWRSDYAVQPSWNDNGLYTEYTVPDGSSLNVWEGPASSQDDLPGGLSTGKNQIWMPPGTLSPTDVKPTGW